MRTAVVLGTAFGVAVLAGVAAWVAARQGPTVLAVPGETGLGSTPGPAGPPSTADAGPPAAGPAAIGWPGGGPGRSHPGPAPDGGAAGGPSIGGIAVETDPRGVERALQYLGDPSYPLEKKLLVAMGLGKLLSRAAMTEGGAAVVAAAAQALADTAKFHPDEDVKWAALQALGERIPFSDPVISAMLARSLTRDSGGPGAARTAAAALRLVLENDLAAPATILEVVGDCPFPSVRAEAASRLEEISLRCPPRGGDDLYDPLEYAATARGTLRDLTEAQRTAVESRHRERQGPGPLGRVLEALRSAPDPQTRRSLFVVLTALPAARALPVFEDAAAHEADRALREDLAKLVAALREGRTDRRKDLLPALRPGLAR
ncbi:MAG: hypothetical protein L0216_09615 [Planctomycetales bacterium]|nr:hypothetical protein [Planctomycetales bacterium]